MYTIDDSLPFILNILLANFFGLLGIAFVLSYAQVNVCKLSFNIVIDPVTFFINSLKFSRFLESHGADFVFASIGSIWVYIPETAGTYPPALLHFISCSIFDKKHGIPIHFFYSCTIYANRCPCQPHIWLLVFNVCFAM